MNPITIGAALLAFVKSLPDIIDFMKTVKGIVDSLGQYWERKEQLQKLNAALQKAKTTGDTSDLESIFKPASSAPTVSK